MSEKKSGWEMLMESDGDKKFGAHNERNQGPLLEKLLVHLPQLASPSPEIEPLELLEVASGTGQHAAFLAGNLHNVVWNPTDYDLRCIKSTDLWTADVRVKVKPCALLDVTADPTSWCVPCESMDVIYNCNMIHLAPIEVMNGFCAGAGYVARANAKLFIYGPFTVDGEHISESNANFDASLRARLDREIAAFSSKLKLDDRALSKPQALWEVCETAKKPSGFLMVKIQELERGVFTGAGKLDREIAAFSSKLKLDDRALSKLIEVVQPRRDSLREDLRDLERLLRGAPNPSGAVVPLLMQLKSTGRLPSPPRRRSRSRSRSRSRARR